MAATTSNAPWHTSASSNAGIGSIAGLGWAGALMPTDSDVKRYMELMRNMQGTSIPAMPSTDVAVMERPAAKAPAKAKTPYIPVKYVPAPEALKGYNRDQLAEYSEIAGEIGFSPAGLRVEEFKSYLIESGITVFSLKTVTEFMDAKSKAEGQGWGWNWCPLRAEDRILAKEKGLVFGRPAGRNINNEWSQSATDHFTADNPLYGHVIPLHALKKVARIEKEFGTKKVMFAVSDYAPAPAFRVDPFLLAVIPNATAARGEGRFVIDVWDEPGFGIEQMLQTDLSVK